MKLLQKYINGGYTVKIFDDGTKIWEGEGEREFPDSMDVKITDYCDAGCRYCHEMSTKQGNHGDLSLFLEGIKKLPKGIEIAIGGGNPLSHPGIVPFLKELKDSGYIPNITVNSQHQHQITKDIEDSVYGIGISLSSKLEYNSPNMVIHFIAGIHTPALIKSYLDQGYKCLILGYKTWGRGVDYIKQIKNVTFCIDLLREELPTLVGQLAFDSLAVKQLNPKTFVPKDYWDLHYTGDDGTLSMYFDLVKGEYCKNSFAKDRYKFDGDISKSFNHIKQLG